MSATIKPGCGYWNVTRYPYGGDFRRTGEAGLPVTALEPFNRFSDGTVSEYAASFDGGKLVVKACNLEAIQP